MTANAHDLQSHHVGLTVSDLEAVLPFYRDVLGFDVADRFEVDGEAFSEAVGIDGAAADFVHLEADGIRVELVEYDPQARDSPNAGLNQPGAKHLGFTVEDLEAFYTDLPDDVETVSEPQTTATGNSILFLRDPEDNLVEVLEIAE